MRRWKRKSGSAKSARLTLGLQAAAARATEEAHRSHHSAADSLLSGLTYDQPADLGTWLSVEWSTVDADITDAIAEFRQAQAPVKASITAALTMDDFYLLCAYAKRCASFALAERDIEHVSNGLSGLAAIDPERIDPRDISWSAGYLRLALTKLTTSSEADNRFDGAAWLAEPTTAKILRSFLGRSYDTLTSEWLMTVIEAEGHLVIVERGKGRYEPKADLLGAANRLAGILVADGLRPGRPTLGGEVGFVWLDSTPGAQILLESATATVAIGSSDRDGDGPFSQLFLVFLFELRSKADQAAFTSSWAKGSRHFASLALGADRLVALFITNSSVAGVPPVETDRSLERFASATLAILNTTNIAE